MGEACCYWGSKSSVALQVNVSPADAGLERVINNCFPDTVAVNGMSTGNAEQLMVAEDRTPTSGSNGSVEGPPPAWGTLQGVMEKVVLTPSPRIGKLMPQGISIPLDGVDVLALPLSAAKVQVPRESNSNATRIRIRMCSLLAEFIGAGA